MASYIYDIAALYGRIFKTDAYFIEEVSDRDLKPLSGGYTIPLKKYTGTLPETIKSQDAFGVDVWLPTWFEGLPPDIGDNGTIYLPYCVMRLSGSSTIVRTPVAERKGTVKELFSVDDDKITIKGFFIDKAKREYPEKDLIALKKLHKLGQSFKIRNHLTDIFLSDTGVQNTEQNMVVITSFDLPEQGGGRIASKAFIMSLESDNIFTLEVE